jgi:MinD superfamily P-loop ATPase
MNVYEITINFLMDSEQEPTQAEIRRQLDSFDASTCANVELCEEDVDLSALADAVREEKGE